MIFIHPQYAAESTAQGYPAARREKQALQALSKEDIARAKALENKARKLSGSVIKDLGVKDGKYNMAQWYRSQVRVMQHNTRPSFRTVASPHTPLSIDTSPELLVTFHTTTRTLILSISCQNARKASIESTRDVEMAREEWGVAEHDEARLKALERNPVFLRHEEALSR